MQKSDLPSFFYSRRSYWLLCKTFFCTHDTTYFLGSNFPCFLPDCSTQHKGSLDCLSVSLSISLGEAMSSDYLLSRSIDDVRDTLVFLLVRSLLSPILERGLTANQQFAWTDGNVVIESQLNTLNISVNTSCVESFRARKQIFQKLYTLYIFQKKQFSSVKS